MIDTHCHLTFPDFADRIDAVVARAAEAGVTGMITISTTTVDCDFALEIATHHDNIWCSAGVHPLYSDQEPHDWVNLVRVAGHERCVAWGELGLDNHYDHPPRALQDRVLADQLAAIESARAGGVDKPVILHCREAYDDLIPILKSTELDPGRFVFHCFTGGPEEARKVLDFGAMISFTGVVTYKNAPQVREAAALCPASRIMIETDAPFLSPAPKRGVRPCEPWMVSYTARAVAEARSESFDDFHRQINENSRRFFGIPV